MKDELISSKRIGKSENKSKETQKSGDLTFKIKNEVNIPEVFGLGTSKNKDFVKTKILMCNWPYQPKAEQEDNENYTF